MNVHDIKWPRRFLDLAYQVASWSKDPSTQVGAVVVDQQGHPMSFGFNGMPKTGIKLDRGTDNPR